MSGDILSTWPERARKNLALILTRLSSVGQAEVAKSLEVSESLISKAKSGDLELVAKILARCGIKCVPSHLRCYEPKQMEAILVLAKERLAQIESAEDLARDDE